MGIQLILRNLDRKPFYHGYGPNCSEKELVYAIWDCPITDLNGQKFTLPFYVVKGNGLLLLGNTVIHRSDLLGDNHLLVIPAEAGFCSITAYVPTYNSQLDCGLRTYMNLVPSNTSSFGTYFTASRSLLSSKMVNPVSLSHGKIAKAFATRLHAFTHLSVEDMYTICRRAQVLTPILEQALKVAFDKCIPCKTTGKPKHSRKVSFSRILRSFNDHLQIDFLFIRELNNLPILQMVDTATSFKATVMLSTRDVEDAARAVKTNWINIYGAPAKLSSDPEFNNDLFKNAFKEYHIQFEPRPARMHNKMGIVESGNFQIRLFVQRLFDDAEYLHTNKGVQTSTEEILSKATFLANVLFGGKKLSSFEQAKGYSPRLCGLPQSPLHDEIVEAHRKQVTRRAIHRLLSSRDNNAIKKSFLKPKTPIYFFVPGTKFGTWEHGFVMDAKDHYVEVSRNSRGRGKRLSIAYEHIRLAPSSALLYELDKCELALPGCPETLVRALRQEELVTSGEIASNRHSEGIASHQTSVGIEPRQDEVEILPQLQERGIASHDSREPGEFERRKGIENLSSNVGIENLHQLIDQAPVLPQKRRWEDIRVGEQVWPTSPRLDDFNPIHRITQEDFNGKDAPSIPQLSGQTRGTSTPDVPEVQDLELHDLQLRSTESYPEDQLWIRHPNSSTYLTRISSESHSDTSTHVNRIDVASSTIEDPEKDIGDSPVLSPSALPTTLDSVEQKILLHMKNIIGDDTVTDSKLQFAPRWILDKAIQNERKNYKDAYKSLPRKDVPTDANIITSHHFFCIKPDGEENRLKLKCRLVPHGNKDRDKDFIRKDSSTAQFPIIRALLSVAALLQFSLGSLDIKSAYLQSGELTRDVYMIPPKGWRRYPSEIWKLIKPAYGLTESGRLWQLAVEDWLLKNGYQSIPGLPQLFVHRDNTGQPLLLIAKVVDDFLLAGSPDGITQFYQSISKAFKVGRFIVNKPFIFNRLHISQDPDGTIHVSMQEYFDKIEKIQIPRHRRKEYKSSCTPQEKTLFLGLTGKLNFLGHGILPQASFVASYLQQKIGDLRIEDMATANTCLHELKKLSPTLVFKSFDPRAHRSLPASYLVFSDASQGKTSYGQTGYISGIYLGFKTPIFHLIDWNSSKQGRVSFSSIGAEILAAAESADRGIHMNEGIYKLFQCDRLPLVLTVDSDGLYSTITTLHDSRDY